MTSISTRIDRVFGNQACITVFIGPDSDHRAVAGQLVCRLDEIEELTRRLDDDKLTARLAQLTQERDDIQTRLDGLITAYNTRIATISRVWELLEHARKVSPSERAVIYAADLQTALDGVERDGPRKTGSNG